MKQERSEGGKAKQQGGENRGEQKRQWHISYICEWTKKLSSEGINMTGMLRWPDTHSHTNNVFVSQSINEGI